MVPQLANSLPSPRSRGARVLHGAKPSRRSTPWSKVGFILFVTVLAVTAVAGIIEATRPERFEDVARNEAEAKRALRAIHQAGPPLSFSRPDARVIGRALLPVSFGNLEQDALGDGVVVKDGYAYKLILPGRCVDGVVLPLPEHPLGGSPAWTRPDSAWSERCWVLYAWPITAGRVFAINQDSEVVFYENRDSLYKGLGHPPAWNAAFALDPEVQSHHMGSRLSGLANDEPGADGNIWLPLNR